MEIKVTKLDGTFIVLYVNPEDTVGSLKLLIQQKLGVAPHSQKLIFVNGQKTTLSDDSKAVCSYGLQSGSQVSLLVTKPATFQVFLRNLQGKLTTYDVKPDETVEHFKSRVQSRENVPVSQQRLTHESKDMQGGKLSDYNVQAGSTIEMTSRLRGG